MPTAPPRVKVYGLIALTRRQYLMTLLGAMILLAVLTPLWFSGGREGLEAIVKDHWPPLARWVRYLPWVVLLAVVLEGIEALFVLRRFAALEREQQHL